MGVQSESWKRETDFSESDHQKDLYNFHEVTLKTICQAATRIYDAAVETPCSPAAGLSASLGLEVFFKREDLQPVFSFKVRGAYNYMNLLIERRNQGVHSGKQFEAIASSAGNHAQGVAFAAQKLGVPATIYMPTTTPDIKVSAVRSRGGKVVLHGDTFDAAAAAAKEHAARESLDLIHPFDDKDVISGQGVVGLEILRQIRRIDFLFVPVGGGGLAAGVGVAIKSVNPTIRIIGVEATDAAGMTASFRAGRPILLESVGPFADGAAVRRIGDLTFNLLYHCGGLDELITVSTDEICAAIKDGFDNVRVMLEPAGALAIAGLKKYVRQQKLGSQQKPCTGRKPRAVCILSGANTDFDRLRFISWRADTSEQLIAIVAPERPGIFSAIYHALSSRVITEFSYRSSMIRASIKKAEELKAAAVRKGSNTVACILLSYRVPLQQSAPSDLHELQRALEAQDMRLISLNSSELAKVHGRHIVGGRAPIEAEEVICRFEYPERPGGLGTFLECLQDRWNVSLFHYRNHGADVGRILAGLQVPAAELEVFHTEFVLRLQQRGYRCHLENHSPFSTLFLNDLTHLDMQQLEEDILERL